MISNIISDLNNNEVKYMNIDINNIEELKKLQKYTIWHSYFSFWMYGWFVLYITGVIKIQPPLLFYYLCMIFIIIVAIFNLNTNKFSNYTILSIQVISGIILDVIPIFCLSSKNILTDRANIILLIYVTIYLITMKLRFKDEEYFKLIFNIYFNYNNISRYEDINIQKYLMLKYNINLE